MTQVLQADEANRTLNGVKTMAEDAAVKKMKEILIKLSPEEQYVRDTAVAALSGDYLLRCARGDAISDYLTRDSRKLDNVKTCLGTLEYGAELQRDPTVAKDDLYHVNFTPLAFFSVIGADPDRGIPRTKQNAELIKGAMVQAINNPQQSSEKFTKVQFSDPKIKPIGIACAAAWITGFEDEISRAANGTSPEKPKMTKEQVYAQAEACFRKPLAGELDKAPSVAKGRDLGREQARIYLSNNPTPQAAFYNIASGKSATR